MDKTAHTCNQGRGPAYGRKTPGCPRCDELLAGAEPRTLNWVETKQRRERDDAQRAREIAEHDCRTSRCGSVCTAFQW